MSAPVGEIVPETSRVAIREAEPGRVTIAGELTFATARAARLTGLEVLESVRGKAQSIVLDCSLVSRADSAGLAVLLDWLAWSRRKAQPLRLENLPASLLAIARISEVDGLLTDAR